METKFNSTYLIQIFIANIVLLVGLLGFLLFKIYPDFVEGEKVKQDIVEKNATYNRIVQEGISFGEFIDQKNQNANVSEYIKDLIKIMPESFYNKNIKSGSGVAFAESIQGKIANIEKQKKEKVSEERDKRISSILPSYNDTLISDQDSLTDFKFVNYVESILYAFNLNSTDTIGISTITPVNQFLDSTTSGAQQNTIETNIYSIPLKLKVRGGKGDIVDFLHFVENVGGIRVNKGEEVTFYEDKFIQKSLPGEEKNIYENQIFDIENMKMPTYLDSTLSPSNLSLVDLVKKEQANEAMELELQLNFYVKGLPNYLAKKYVKDMTTRYDELTKKVETRMKELSLRQFETSEDILLVNSVKTISFDLKKYAEDIKKIKAALAKGERLETLYKTSTEYTTKFDTMEGLLVKIDKNLQLNNNKK